MRLLDTTTLELKEFFSSSIFDEPNEINHDSWLGINDESGVPCYAILSHTWGNDEVLYQDITGDLTKAEKKLGYSKIANSCERAASDGWRYIWIDTCCIDKSSSAELSEAINSMYDWYYNAEVCYAYMSDVSMTPDLADEIFIACFSASRWFTRGWTLQELLAPSKVHFYNSEWILLGTKEHLVELVSIATNIDPCALCRDANLNDFTIARRMLWASRRQTTRPEDMAYCLLGIFGIRMPLLYGEEENAFVRLQTEIMKTNHDQSIFAWGSPIRSTSFSTDGPLALSPTYFRASSSISQFHNPGRHAPLSLPVGGGVQTKVLLQEGRESYEPTDCFAILHCDVGNIPGLLAGIMLKSIRFTPTEFCRSNDMRVFMFANSSSDYCEIIQGFDPNAPQARLVQVIPGGENIPQYNWMPRTISIKSSASSPIDEWLTYRIVSPHLFSPEELKITNVYPSRFWDSHTQTLRPRGYSFSATIGPVLIWLTLLGRRCTLVIRPKEIITEPKLPNSSCYVVKWIEDAASVKWEYVGDIRVENESKDNEFPQEDGVMREDHDNDEALLKMIRSRREQYWDEYRFNDKALEMLGDQSETVGCEQLFSEKNPREVHFIRLFLKGDLEDKSAGPTGEASLLRNYKINLKKWEVRGLGRAVVGKVTG